MKKQGGEHGEDSEESLERMFGREYIVTCGDLTLLSAVCRYNKTYAASEVSWIVVVSKREMKASSLMYLNPDYIVGLVDGEGSFTVYIRNVETEKKVLRRVTVEPKFYLKLIEKDKEILEALKNYFGCGSVYFQKDTRPNHQNCYRYEVYNRNDITSVIIPFFKKHTLKFNSKRSDFETFCVLMKMINDGYHLTKSGLIEMFAIKQTMH